MFSQKTLKVLLLAILISWLALIFFSNNLFYTLRNFKDSLLGFGGPTTYSIGQFDERFGISKEDFLSDINKSIGIWETAAGRKLFKYSPNGKLKINLVYDSRQNLSDQLKKSQQGVDLANLDFESQKSSYNDLTTLYRTKKDSFDQILLSYKAEKAVYEARVSEIKAKPVTQEELNILNTEREYLNSIVAELNKQQEGLNLLVKKINSFAQNANDLIPKLNTDIAKYNNLVSDAGQEFQEGEYVYGINAQAINVYQFDNQQTLVALLTHEFGHALGLEHINDSEAIMYRLNYSKSTQLSSGDLEALKKVLK